MIRGIGCGVWHGGLQCIRLVLLGVFCLLQISSASAESLQSDQTGEMAQRIKPGIRLKDLSLAGPQARALRETADGARKASAHGTHVLLDGAGREGRRVAEALAGEMELDLLQVEMHKVVSKYMGETEKNLRRVFDAAENAGAVLFLDGADALFGKRTEVEYSDDRYANIEIGYLLQRIEKFRGLVVFSTNVRITSSEALSRFHRVVRFPPS